MAGKVRTHKVRHTHAEAMAYKRRQAEAKAVPEWIVYLDDKWWRVAGKTELKAMTVLKKILKKHGIVVPNGTHLKESNDWSQQCR